MIPNLDTHTDKDAIPNDARASNDCTRHDDTAFTYLCRMANMHEIVYLGIFPNDSTAKRGAVDAGISAYLDIVTKNNVAFMGPALAKGGFRIKTKAFFAYHAVSAYCDVFASNYALVYNCGRVYVGPRLWQRPKIVMRFSL